MSNTCLSVWLEIKGPGKRKLICGSVYREHQHLYQVDEEFRTNVAQVSRWRETCNQWECSLRTKADNILLGYMNINFNKWDNLVAIQKRLIEIVKDKIIPLGVT